MADVLDRIQQVIVALEQITTTVRQDDAPSAGIWCGHVIGHLQQVLALLGEEPLEDAMLQRWWQECRGKISTTIVGLQLLQVLHLVQEQMGQQEGCEPAP
jgi:hypothetical protein